MRKDIVYPVTVTGMIRITVKSLVYWLLDRQTPKSLLFFILLNLFGLSNQGWAVPTPEQTVEEFCSLEGKGVRILENSRIDLNKLKKLFVFPKILTDAEKQFFYIFTDYKILYGVKINTEAVVYVKYSYKWLGNQRELIKNDQTEQLGIRLLNTTDGWKISEEIQPARISLKAGISYYKEELLKAVEQQNKSKVRRYSEFIEQLSK